MIAIRRIYTMNLTQLDGKRVVVTLPGKNGRTIAIDGVAALIRDPHLGEALCVTNSEMSLFLQSSNWHGTIAGADAEGIYHLDVGE